MKWLAGDSNLYPCPHAATFREDEREPMVGDAKGICCALHTIVGHCFMAQYGRVRNGFSGKNKQWDPFLGFYFFLPVILYFVSSFAIDRRDGRREFVTSPKNQQCTHSRRNVCSMDAHSN